MDVNITGAMAANISLLQPSNTGINLFQSIVDLLPAIISALAALVAIWLANIHNERVEKDKSLKEEQKFFQEERKKWFEDRRYAYQNFLNILSETYVVKNSHSDKVEVTPEAEFELYSSKLLGSAIDILRFGDLKLKKPIKSDVISVEITSLSHLIEYILVVRLSDNPLDQKIKMMHDIKDKGTDGFMGAIMVALSNESPEIEIP